MKKNSIVEWINHGIDFTSELVPCKGLGCPDWKRWESPIYNFIELLFFIVE